MKKMMTPIALLLLLFGIAQADQHSAESLLNALRKDLMSLKAKFIQYHVTEDNKKEDENTGHVWLMAPDQFRWHYQTPMEQLIIADGKKVWVYDEDLEQVTVKAQNNQLNPIYVIINESLSEQHYTFKLEASSQGVDWISLTPKDDKAEVKNVWLAIKDNTIHRIKVVNQLEQTLMFEFHEVTKNPELKAGLFQFTPPEGVDVIVEAADQTGGEF